MTNSSVFSSTFHQNNRKKFAAVADVSFCVFPAHALLQRSADVTYAFRQDSTFWYLTGIHEPGCLLVLEDGEPALVLPERDTARDLWEGVINTTELTKQSGIKTVQTWEQFTESFKKQIAKHKYVGTLLPPSAPVSQIGFEPNPARSELLHLLETHGAQVQDVRPVVAKIRQVKEKVEIAALQRSIDITTKAFSAIKSELTKFATEKDIHYRFNELFAGATADGHAYEPIIASGAHATTLHYTRNSGAIQSGSLLLLDVGAEKDMYASDITRTWAVGTVTERHVAVHKLVEDAQHFAFSLLKPGVSLREYDQEVHAYLSREALSRGIVTTKKQASALCPHSISHFLGLDVHDAGSYDEPLQPGMVLTVEPGIYLLDEGIGVRIEDDVLVTENGIKIMSERLPAGL